jgi:hypothetical protein
VSSSFTYHNLIIQLQKYHSIVISLLELRVTPTHTPTYTYLQTSMCLFNLFSKHEEKNDLPPPRPANIGRRTPEATSRLQGSKFSSDASRRSSADKDKYGYGTGYSSGNGSLGVGGPHGGLYGGVNGGVYSGVSGGANGGVNGGVYGGVSGTSHGSGLAPGGMGTSPGGGYGYL